MSQDLITTTPTTPILYNESANKYARASKAETTQTAYRSLWRSFITWLGVDTLPVSVAAVINYITYLADSGYKVATINSTLAAIKSAHNLAGYPSPTDHPDISIVFDGIRRTLKVKPTKKASLDIEELKTIVDSLPDTLTGKRDKALILIGFAGAFRRSELVSLTVEDVKITKSKATVTLQHSKTDQEGKGLIKVIPALENKSLCPVAALNDWLNASGITSGPIFRMIDKWGKLRDAALSGQSVALILKAHAKENGMYSGRFAGHSLRRGLINAALENGATTTDIRQLTHHASESAFNEYIEANGNASIRAIKTAFGEG